MSAAVLVDRLGRAKRLAPVNCQMLFSASPMKRTWMVASSERTWKVQLASEPSAWGTSRQTLRCTQPFTPFAAILGFAGALGRRLIAPLGPPSSTVHCQVRPLSSSGSYLLSVNGKRKSTVWTGMSGQSVSERRTSVWKQERHKEAR